MSDAILLVVDGAVERPLTLRFADLAALPAATQIPDVSRFHPRRQGDGVALEAILERAGVKAEANYLTLHADRDDFHVSVPLQAVRAEGIVVYHRGGEPLGADAGRADPVPDPRSGRLPHPRARRLRRTSSSSAASSSPSAGAATPDPRPTRSTRSCTKVLSPGSDRVGLFALRVCESIAASEHMRGD